MTQHDSSKHLLPAKENLSLNKKLKGRNHPYRNTKKKEDKKLIPTCSQNQTEWNERG